MTTSCFIPGHRPATAESEPSRIFLTGNLVRALGTPPDPDRQGLPENRAHAIEAIQTEFHTQPQITIWRLGNREDRALGKTVTYLPRHMRILADIQLRIQRPRSRTAHEE